ncbi:Acyl-CoA synthetases (AMP-forming)/AMP-acid ligases II [Polynucleobacter duraquae]|uniref:Acyl-CoA synthetases (AMP-forming)/AMP-acid ligases II n=1 Tax=Polynucleobacter duraquae TaxID=1835254 RepID=A0A0E3UZT8_9BURK|nr:fatty acid--CoA ligase family protein [Polynucleobacter duraquae]AKD24679.1 Acyl-CoA synthetases (AMP-forming)/AMP-acid ligases II [Polynucleobacter duraquae]
MNEIDTLLKRMEGFGSLPAIIWKNNQLNYIEFVDLINDWELKLPNLGVTRGTVCSVLGDFSPKCCALFFALMKAGSIVVPLTKSIVNESEQFKRIAGVQISIEFADDDSFNSKVEDSYPDNFLIKEFRSTKNSSGLVVFSSGSTGEPKGILHDFECVIRKFISQRKGWKSILFLLMDHFGGFNTFIAAFAYGGVAVCVHDRDPSAICEAIQSSRATLLPTTPTFINLLIASRAFMSFDLSSIELITYGTEVMPEATLNKLKTIFPNASLKQTYGLSEVGVLRSKSENDASLWVKIGGDGFEVRIENNILWIKSESNMVGYLNAPSPFDEGGWMCTGDQVEVNGDYMRIIGRKSEMINVGGQKVFPAEIETILLEDENVKEATVYGVKNPLMGHVVHANIALLEEESSENLTIRLRKSCILKLAKYKIPVKFNVVHGESQRNERFKKIRTGLDKS